MTTILNLRSPRILLLSMSLAGYSLAPAQSTEVVVHSFGNPAAGSLGANPYGGVVIDGHGNIYGTTANGGASNVGVIYKIDSAGKQKVIYSFKDIYDGYNPYTAVTLDSAGNIYGTTLHGGYGDGTVYEVDAAGHELMSYYFGAASDDGSIPSSGVVRDAAGNLYGVTSKGGASNYGTVYKIDPSGAESIVYSFTGGKDGSGPNSLIRDDAGNLFGTTAAGGYGSGLGVVFKIDTAGHESVAYRFNGTDGAMPMGVALDSAGNLYGTAMNGGAFNYGVVFELTAGRERVLYSFPGGANGANPVAGLVLDAAGNIYGTTMNGVVFQLDTAGQESVIYSLNGSLASGVTLDSSGNLYGVIPSPGNGVVYKITPAGQETVLDNFTPTTANLSYPAGKLAMDSSGNLYGLAEGALYKVTPAGQLTTFSIGGSWGVTLDSAGNLYGTDSSGQGYVYKVDLAGQETVLYTFTGQADGGQPNAVVPDSAGNVYGVTSSGGYGHGVIYKVDPAGKETVLYNFQGGTYGENPTGLIRDKVGNLFGTARGGKGYGIVFEFDAAGQFAILCNFNSTTGGDPVPGVALDLAGNLYGATSAGGTEGKGVVYKIDPAGNYSVLYNFCSLAKCADGAVPSTGVVLDPSGNVYGATSNSYRGNSGQPGSVYMVSPAGQETVLYAFCSQPNCADGKKPDAIFRNPAGDLFGTTYYGGVYGAGVLFKITPP